MAGGSTVWLGGTDIEVEGTWRWLDNMISWMGNHGGGPPTDVYADFGNGELNDASGKDCLGISGDGWNDVP